MDGKYIAQTNRQAQNKLKEKLEQISQSINK